MGEDNNSPPRKPHTETAILRCLAHVRADGAAAIALETVNMGTIFVQMSPEAVRGALNEVELILAQGTGNA